MGGVLLLSQHKSEQYREQSQVLSPKRFWCLLYVYFYHRDRILWWAETQKSKTTCGFQLQVTAHPFELGKAEIQVVSHVTSTDGSKEVLNASVVLAHLRLCSARVLQSCTVQDTKHTGFHRLTIKTTPRDMPTGQLDTNKSSIEILSPRDSRLYWELKSTQHCLFGFPPVFCFFLCSPQIPK